MFIFESDSISLLNEYLSNKDEFDTSHLRSSLLDLDLYHHQYKIGD